MALIVTILTWWLTLAAAVVAVPALVVLVETIAAAFGGRDDPEPEGGRPPLAVVIPAHDEAAIIARTLESVRAQLDGRDRLVVVADNCSDSTADEARRAGAEVVERIDAERRGKGYALARGLEAVREDPRPIVVVLDADCELSTACLDRLARRAATTKRPVQAVYLMDPPANPTAGDRVSALAVRFKNLVRPLGLDRMGLGVLLTGSGMSFPIETLEGVDLATGDLVEDMGLGIELARRGRTPTLCPGARVSSRLPGADASRRSQRTRWEHGHLATLVRHGPRLIAEGIMRGRARLITLGLEVCVPPTSLLVLGTAALVGVGLAWTALTWRAAPLAIALEASLMIAGAFAIGWWRFGRDVLPARDLPAVGVYALRKIPIYAAAIVARQRTWVRTARDEAVTDEPPPRPDADPPTCTR